MADATDLKSVGLLKARAGSSPAIGRFSGDPTRVVRCVRTVAVRADNDEESFHADVALMLSHGAARPRRGSRLGRSAERIEVRASRISKMRISKRSQRMISRRKTGLREFTWIGRKNLPLQSC